MKLEEIHADLDRLTRAEPYVRLADAAVKMLDAATDLRDMAGTRENQELYGHQVIPGSPQEAALQESREKAAAALRRHADSMPGLADAIIRALSSVEEGRKP